MRCELTDSGDTRFILSKAEVTCFVAYASKHTTRNICAVRFEVRLGKCFIAATDGHRIVVAECRAPDGATEHGASIQRDAMALTLKTMARDNDLAVVANCASAHLYIGKQFQAGDVGILSTRTVKLDSEATYPPYETLFTESEDYPAKKVGFDTAFLADLHLVAKASGRSDMGMSLELGGELDPSLWRCESPDGTSFRVLLMPMRM